jgi:hypothetical protein
MFDEYEVYYCEKCKKHIHYFKKNKCFEGYHCWQCAKQDGMRALNELIMRRYFDGHPTF